MITNEHIKTLEARVYKLKNYLSIDKKIIEINDEEEKTSNPDFWNNPKNAEFVMREIRSKKKWVEDYNLVVDALSDFQVLFDFYKHGEISEQEVETSYEKTVDILEKLEFKNMLSEQGDSLSAVLQITAGAGGTESCDWAHMLMRMYIMWGEKNNYKVKELNYQSGDTTGIKTVTLEFEGEYSFGYLKGENGVHRLVRISPFDSNAKRHTSFASVYVYPMIDNTIEIDINPADISWQFARSGGPGGQGVNKIESKAILTHNPSGIIIHNSETRSQLENREKAMKLLKSQLYEIELAKKVKKRDEIEAGKMKIDFGSQIRNYVMHPYKLVKDLRTQYETANIDAVIDGDLDPFIKAYLMMLGQKEQGKGFLE